MNLIKNKIFINFISLTGSNVVAKLIGFLATIIIAKVLSVNDYGVYKWYSVIIGYFILLINFGFDVYFYKLIFNKNFSLEKIIAIQLKSRVIFGSLIYVVSVIAANYFIENFIYKILFFILSLQIIFYIFNIEILIKIKEKFIFLSIYTIIKSILNLLLVFYFIKNQNDIIILSTIVIFINFITVIGHWFYIIQKFKISLKKILYYIGSLKFNYIIKHLKKSLVINLSFFMISIYYNLDSLMLGLFKTNSDVAIYSVAYAFILMAIMPTGMLYSAFSPKLSKNIYNKQVFFQYIVSTIILGVVIFVFLLFTYKYLILYTYGKKYEASIEILFYLSFNIIPCYLAGAFANPINLWGDYKKYLFIVSMGAIGNFIGNLIFIPLYGIKGAIFTTILSEVLVFIFAIRYWIKHKELLK
jgi:O-antigen/teichoic acid export membrane protein